MFGFFNKVKENRERKSEINAIQTKKALKLEYIDLLESKIKAVSEDLEKEFANLLKNKRIMDIVSFGTDDYKVIQVTNDERLKLIEKELAELKLLENPACFYPSRNAVSISVSNRILTKFKNYELLLRKYALTPINLEHVINSYVEFDKALAEAIAYLEKESAIIGSGLHGEGRVNKELDMYDYMWTNLSNIRFEVDGESVESDNILISTKGIYTLEVKNYAPKGNYALSITKDGQWLKVYPNGKREAINNVTAQVNRHIAYKQKLINHAWQSKHGKSGKPIIIEPIFVLANDKVQIQNETNLPVMRASSIYHYLKDKPDIFTQEQVDALVAIVQENNLPPLTYDFLSYSETMREKLKILEEQANYLVSIKSFISRFVFETDGIVKKTNRLEMYKEVATAPNTIRNLEYDKEIRELIIKEVSEKYLPECQEQALQHPISSPTIVDMRPFLEVTQLSNSERLSLAQKELNQMANYHPDTIRNLLKRRALNINPSHNIDDKSMARKEFYRATKIRTYDITDFTSNLKKYEDYYFAVMDTLQKEVDNQGEDGQMYPCKSYMEFIEKYYTHFMNRVENVNIIADIVYTYRDKIREACNDVNRYGY